MAVTDIIGALPRVIQVMQQLEQTMAAQGVNIPAEIQKEEAGIDMIVKKFQKYVADIRAGHRTIEPNEKAPFITELNNLQAVLLRLDSVAHNAGVNAVDHPIRLLIKELIALRNLAIAGANAAAGVQQVVQQTSYIETKLLKFDQQLNTFVTDLGKEVKIAEGDLYSELTKEQQTMAETQTALKDLSVAANELRAMNFLAASFATELKQAGQLLLNLRRETRPQEKFKSGNALKTMDNRLIALEGPLVLKVTDVETKINTAITNAKTTLGNQVVGEKLGQAALKNVSKALADTKKMVTDLGALKTALLQERTDALTELNILHQGQYGIPL